MKKTGNERKRQAGKGRKEKMGKYKGKERYGREKAKTNRRKIGNRQKGKYKEKEW